MKKINIIILSLIGILYLISCTTQGSKSNLTGDYLGQDTPKNKVLIFAPKIISTEFNERDAAFSPKGDEFFYSLKGPLNYSLIQIKKVAGIWLEPEVAEFSGKYSDLEPCFSPDGKKLFFVSNRPLDNSGDTKDYDIWFSEKTDSGWGKPINPGEPLNASTNEFYPSIVKNGTVYFCSRTKGSIGGEDLFYSKFINGKFQRPINLGDSINTTRDEFNAFVSPNEKFIIYTSTGFGVGFGGGDLWISFKNKNNVWEKPINMGDEINSTKLDYSPNITPDGKYLFFTSNRIEELPVITKPLSYDEIIKKLKSPYNGGQNIYWVSTAIIDSLK